MSIKFLVVFKPGPTWLTGKPLAEQPIKEHGRYMLSLFAQGKMSMGGSFSDDAGGAVTLEVTDEAEAHALIAADPCVQSGVFVAEMHPWKLVSWESYLKQ